MAKPGEQNLTYTEGDDEAYPVTLVRPDASPLDLTGSTVAVEVRDGFASEGGALIATATCTITDAVNGAFLIELSDDDTKVMGGANLKFDIQVTDAGGKKKTYVRGEIQGTKEVTDL